jgi:hypothetical protein
MGECMPDAFLLAFMYHAYDDSFIPGSASLHVLD